MCTHEQLVSALIIVYIFMIYILYKVLTVYLF